MRVLVTGSRGFVGMHVRRALAESGHCVLPDAGGGDARGDLTADGVADALVREARPDAVVHLAARADPHADSWEGLLRANQLACLRVLEAITRYAPHAHAVIASSSAVYGSVPRERNPIDESESPRPVTMYGASKAGTEAIAFAFAASGVRVTVCRPFNTIGPGGDKRSALAHWTRKLADLDGGADAGIFHCGPLNTSRDLTDVRDIARAYVSIVEHSGTEPVLNLCTGRAVEGAALLEILFDAAGVRPRVISEAPRPDDVLYQCGDRTRLSAATGWQPVIPIEQTVQDVLREHRHHVSA